MEIHQTHVTRKLYTWSCADCKLSGVEASFKGETTRALVDSVNEHTKSVHGRLTSLHSIIGMTQIEEPYSYFFVRCPVPESVCGRTYRGEEWESLVHNLYIHISHQHPGETNGLRYAAWKEHMG
jgi:predicted small metal-binding protein